MKNRLTLWLLLFGILGGRVKASDSGDAAYQRSFDEWKAELVDDLKQNWLPLAGLYWLKPGENTFGSDQSNAVIFPKGPAHAGSFLLENEQVTVKFLPGINAKIDGKSSTEGVLQPDTSGKSSVVELGRLQWHVIKRAQRIGIRLRDDQSSAVESYAGPTFFPLNLAYRVNATWEPSDGKKTGKVPNVFGDDPAKGLFFVFNDLTAKTETYQGGRFLQTDPVKNGIVVLDFNRAYN